MDTLKPLQDLHAVPVEQLTYEQAFSELEEIVAALESEKNSLDTSLALFERGQKLASYCSKLLDQAELKITQLSADGQEDYAG